MSLSPDEPIRVLRVIARLNVGGPALHVSYLTRELDRRGYETTLAAGSVGEGEGSMEYVARELGIQPLAIPLLQREISPLRDAATVRHLVGLIRELRPHVLHTHTAKAGAVGRAAALLAGAARPKVVVHTFHGHVLRGYFPPPLAEGFRLLERRLADVSDALIAVSPEVKHDLVRLRVAPAKKISVIRLGLDLDGRIRASAEEGAAVRARFGIPEDAYLIGWLGRMTEIKRVDSLLAALAVLRSRGVEADVMLVGDGPLRAELEHRAAVLGLTECCHFAGFSEQVAPFLAAFDTVALTSANEGTPVTLIEALAAELPVVSTNVGGVSDVVQHGRSGFLVPPGDVAALADALGQLAGSPELRREFGRAGRKHVRPRYSVPRLVDDVDSLYRSLLQERAPRSLRVHDALSTALRPAIPPRVDRRRAAKRLRVALVSQYFPPEIGATQSRIQAFADYLSERGHEVTVVCEFPNHPHGVIPAGYAGKLVHVDRSNAYRIVRVWVKASSEKNQTTRMAFYLSYMAMATAVAPILGRVDVVLATSPPLFAGVAGAALAGLNRAPLVLDVRDLWPAAAVSLNQVSGTAARTVGERLERWLYREAAVVVAVTRPFCEHIDRLRGRLPATVMIPNGTLDIFFENGARNRLGLPEDRFLVTFAGTHGIAQGLPAVLDAAELARDTSFAFVGDGPIKHLLTRLAASRSLENVSFHPQVPLEQMPPILAASDALLVPLSSHETFAQFVPSKMVDFMASGRPVILAAAGEPARLLRAARGGIAIPPEDPAALVGAIRWLADHPSEAVEMGVAGKEFARKRLREAQAERLEQLLFDVVES
ncbi:MAG TPA: glycosyltransferase [Gaiellaceae bacterium]|nr:glycosyltransferase [Gaiellaceae bacterium]